MPSRASFRRRLWDAPHAVVAKHITDGNVRGFDCFVQPVNGSGERGWIDRPIVAFSQLVELTDAFVDLRQEMVEPSSVPFIRCFAEAARRGPLLLIRHVADPSTFRRPAASVSWARFDARYIG